MSPAKSQSWTLFTRISYFICQTPWWSAEFPNRILHKVYALTDDEIAKVEEFVRSAATEELLDRATIFRGDHDPDAIIRFEQELRRRRVVQSEIDAHEQMRTESAIARGDGSIQRCEFCERPAELTAWKWHRLWGKVPLFPRPMALCGHHRDGRD